MAPSKPAVDFNAMVNAERKRKENQAIAQEMLGKNRRSSAPGGGFNNRRNGGSLAGRVTGGPAGITKRSATPTRPARGSIKPNAGNVNSEWTHDLHSLNNPSATSSQLPPRGPKALRSNRNGDRLNTVLNGSASSPALNSQFNIVGTAKPPAISIRGAAGPYTVVVKNLALGTTAADTESAMIPIGGTVLSCRLIAQKPKVIAEVIFETKEGADNVVDTLNNQNADGNILHVYHKPGPVSPSIKLAPSKPTIRAVTPLGPRADNPGDRSDESRSGFGGSDRYPRDRSRERRRDYEREDVQDGSYGFDDRMETDDRQDNNRGLYSDNMINNRGREERARSWDRGRNDNRNRGYNR